MAANNKDSGQDKTVEAIINSGKDIFLQAMYHFAYRAIPWYGNKIATVETFLPSSTLFDQTAKKDIIHRAEPDRVMASKTMIRSSTYKIKSTYSENSITISDSFAPKTLHLNWG